MKQKRTKEKRKRGQLGLLKSFLVKLWNEFIWSLLAFFFSGHAMLVSEVNSIGCVLCIHFLLYLIKGTVEPLNFTLRVSVLVSRLSIDRSHKQSWGWISRLMFRQKIESIIQAFWWADVSLVWLQPLSSECRQPLRMPRQARSGSFCNNPALKPTQNWNYNIWKPIF